MRFNPYVAGNPIGEEGGFFGREDVFRDVLQVLQHPQQNAIVLYGQRRIGKTSVLMQLEQRLAQEGAFTPVYFDLMDRAEKPLSEVLFVLAQRISAVFDLPTPDADQFDAQGDYFRDVYLPQVVEASNDRHLTLLFDEFDTLDNPQQSQAGEAFFPYLRRWMAEIKGVKFIFVIGRRPEDLSINTMSTFKGVKSTQVALLAKRDATDVILQATVEGSLRWPDEAVQAVWEWTQGHPYFTQLLCEAVWNLAYRENPTEIPTATTEMISEALKPAQDAGRNAFVWLWDGLPPAERVVMAAIAEADADVISQEELVGILNRSGVRLIVSQLELAPETLEAWGLLQQTDGGYRFAVPLLRRWVRQNRRLNRVKEELDQLEPMAERLFQTGQDYYTQGNLQEAQNQLRRALEINPNHLKSQLLLGQILLDENEVAAAVETLEGAYAYDSRSARASLVAALLKLAVEQTDETQLLATYERILTVAPAQPVATTGRQSLLDRQRQREQTRQKEEVAQLEAQGEWAAAIQIYRKLEQEFPNEVVWSERRQHAEAQTNLQQKYNEALGALETGDRATAQRLLLEVLAVQSDYKEATRYLVQATEGLNVTDLEKQAASAIPQRTVWYVIGAILVIGFLLGNLSGWTLRNSMVAAIPPTNTPTTTPPTNTPTPTKTPFPTNTPTPTKTPFPTNTPDPFIPPLEATLGITWTRPVDNMAMVFVPAGSFIMGSDPEVDPDADSNERPQHEVIIDEFWIDKFEVKNVQYRACLAAGDCNASSLANNETYNGDEYPVIGVSWSDAQNYCEWAGGQLPTEAQWEYAARGEDVPLYPWGDERPTCDLAQFGDCDGNTIPVGSLSPAGDSWVDAADMAGNVWEWVADWYSTSYPGTSETNPTGPESGSSRVLRGGGWSTSPQFVRAANRNDNSPTNRNGNIGLRCVVPPSK